ncbi:maleylpyruvate isomerase family mycothiol-dependent enzyme [Kytococcus sp. Marseille-QA3725]
MSLESGLHARFSRAFAEVADQVTDWDVPTPVKEWRARDIVEHLIDWYESVLENWVDVDLPDRDPDADPATAWRQRSDDVQELLDDSERSTIVLGDGPFAGQTIAEMTGDLYVSDIYMHTWDLARATGAKADLEPDYAEQLLEGMQPIDGMLRQSGQYGPAVETGSEDPVDRLMAFIGRDPQWQRPDAPTGGATPL